MHEGFWWGNLRERNHLEDLAVDVKVDLEKKNWMGVVQNRNK